jgi:hypothetical protein
MIFHADAAVPDVSQARSNVFPMSLQTREALRGEPQFEPNHEDDPSIDDVSHDKSSY